MSRLQERPGCAALGPSLLFWGVWAVAVTHSRGPFLLSWGLWNEPLLEGRTVNPRWAVGTQDLGDIPLSLR